ncbi:MAG: hypothetical protein QXR19_17155 [Candidatus Jordarchaeaceae archaeon]
MVFRKHPVPGVQCSDMPKIFKIRMKNAILSRKAVQFEEPHEEFLAHVHTHF